ncbi:MAG: MotA/TolQ/ExbB proton channel family protein [Verrucomicrobia bacterium]|nr:MotA/TolQ/ExbB proton channel family protein [Verrucomicrobiota bacterium]MBS0636046.1 MotA/TolQ/ExbB proton channel family protein [Verrucomicrobiota bacterium]
MMYGFLCEGNPFFDAYTDSDVLGKIIFVALLALSVVTWSVLIHKLWITKQVKKNSLQFRKTFSDSRHDPLSLPNAIIKHSEYPNAFGIIYDVLKNKTLEIFDKNGKNKNASQLYSADIALLEAHANSTIASLTKFLEKNLYILSTIVTLAPFLGLLGTVYGILTTFTELKSSTGGGSNQIILGGLSLALSTTVLGLIDAIPALLGYNYLKNLVYEFDADMDRFATDVLSTLEIHYRKPGE